jgi:hypothetical protein
VANFGIESKVGVHDFIFAFLGSQEIGEDAGNPGNLLAG